MRPTRSSSAIAVSNCFLRTRQEREMSRMEDYAGLYAFQPDVIG